MAHFHLNTHQQNFHLHYEYYQEELNQLDHHRWHCQVPGQLALLRQPLVHLIGLLFDLLAIDQFCHVDQLALMTLNLNVMTYFDYRSM